MVLGCNGPVLANELRQSQRSDVLLRTRVQREPFDYSNGFRAVSNHQQCENIKFSRSFATCVRSRIRIHLLPCLRMEYLWTPWRYAYISTADKAVGCIFCDAGKSTDDHKTRIVHRGTHCYVILNTFPYTNGHVMIVPYAHLDELSKLPHESAGEMMELSRRVEEILRRLYHPDGINLGMNLGTAAGAGVAGHIHMHMLPRWVADANFMTVVGETRVLPETLETTWEKMRSAFAN